MLAFKIVIGMLVAILGLVTLSAHVVTERLADQVRRYPGVFAGLTEAGRPPATDAVVPGNIVAYPRSHPGAPLGDATP